MLKLSVSIISITGLHKSWTSSQFLLNFVLISKALVSGVEGSEVLKIYVRMLEML